MARSKTTARVSAGRSWKRDGAASGAQAECAFGRAQLARHENCVFRLHLRIVTLSVPRRRPNILLEASRLLADYVLGDYRSLPV